MPLHIRLGLSATSRASFYIYNVKINSEVIFKNLHGDGIIVSTPTGSTGYNVSAGGPIIQPKVYSLVVTPICPVHLNIRSLVLDPESEIEIEVLHDRHSEPVSLTADGKLLSALVGKKEKAPATPMVPAALPSMRQP